MSFSLSSNTIYSPSQVVYKDYETPDIDICWTVGVYDDITPFSAITELQTETSCGVGRCQRCVLTLSSCTNGDIILWTVQYDTPITEGQIFFISGLDDATGAGNCAKVIDPSQEGITTYDHEFTSFNESDYFLVNSCTTGACYNCVSGVTITSLSATSQTVYYTGCTGNTSSLVLGAGATTTIPGCVDLSKTLTQVGGVYNNPSYKVVSAGDCCTRKNIIVNNTTPTTKTITYWKCGFGTTSTNISGNASITLVPTIHVGTFVLPTGVVITSNGVCSSCNP